MYNLFVSGNPKDWEGEPFDLEAVRCVREYTSEDLIDRFASLSEAAIASLKKFPCIFAYESSSQKDPKFGRIVKVDSLRRGHYRITYEIEVLNKFLKHENLANGMPELDITNKFELYRTHWAVKDVNLPLTLADKGIDLPAWTHGRKNTVDIRTHVFDVALSFPGENRPYVEQVIKFLERALGPHTYFYDNNYKSQLARPGLDIFLQDIYKNRARLVVVFLCAAYEEKEWCGVEFRVVLEMIKQKKDKVMYFKTDSGPVKGVLTTDGYVDTRQHTPEEVAEFIRQRVELL